MRGTGYAISEIVWWMLAAGLIGVAIGWLMQRVFGGGARAREAAEKYEAQQERYAEISGELGELKTKSERLSNDLESKGEELSVATGRIGDLEGTLAGVRTELDSAAARASHLEADLTEARAKLDSESSRAASLEERLASTAGQAGEFTGPGDEVGAGSEMQANLAERAATIADLEAKLERVTGELAAVKADNARSSIGADETAGKLAGLEALIAEREARIADLEMQLRQPGAAMPGITPAVAPISDPAEFADLEALAASEAEDSAAVDPPLTKFGTPGAHHTDDLKVVRGIGRKMEELLNGFGIRSWEQLAELSEEDIDRLDEALAEFPDGIRRDEWVAQARAIVANDHQPLQSKDPSGD